jgi:hypothetical protein
VRDRFPKRLRLHNIKSRHHAVVLVL